MSSIGSGPGVVAGPVVGLSAVRAVDVSDAAPTTPNGASTQTGVPASAAPIVTSAALDAGAPPIDQDQVATIRKAIADNSYPLVPTKIGDAMIAAGMLLRMAK